MILDERNEFADAASVAAAAGTTLLGDVIDLQGLGGAGLGNPGDIGNGQPVYFYVSVDTSIITAGSAGTIQFSLVSDAQAAIATNGTATVHYTSKAFVTDDAALNELNAGDMAVMVALPLEGVTYERYLGVLVTVGTTTVTAGAVSAGLTLDPHGWRAYPEGVN
jgi:hypothetical protein